MKTQFYLRQARSALEWAAKYVNGDQSLGQSEAQAIADWIARTLDDLQSLLPNG